MYLNTKYCGYPDYIDTDDARLLIEDTAMAVKNPTVREPHVVRVSSTPQVSTGYKNPRHDCQFVYTASKFFVVKGRNTFTVAITGMM